MTDAPQGPSGAAFAALARVVATDLLDRKDDLNRLDGVAGDGDLGLTVATAARALLELAPTLDALAEAEAIRRTGTEIARRAPSTGGTLIAFALIAAAKAVVDPVVPPVTRAAAYLDAAARSVAERGRVEAGQRTMLDALRPAADAVGRAAGAGEGPVESARAAAAAAGEGAAATASMAAVVGRAGWLADRAAGHEDAGARLIALAFAAAAAHLADAEAAEG
jgi:Dak2 domain-containing protein